MRSKLRSSRSRVTVPPTDCPWCQHQELSAGEYFVCVVSVLWFGTCRHQKNQFSGLGNLMTIAVGGKVLSRYEKHLEAWVETGELIELRRMLRHVTIEP